MRPTHRTRAAISLLGALLVTGSGLAEEEKVLNVYNWSDYIAEDTIENFEDYYVDQDDGHENEDVPILNRIDLNEAMATFPAKSKEILSMKAQGYNYEEISQQTGLSVSGVKMQVKRAFERMRKLLVA